ncbi:MAG: type IV secretory system conjugative DNA transfer family protein [Planctomycetota bacterium]
MNGQYQDLNRLLADLKRGRKPGEVGQLPDAHFELPSNIAATQSMQFNLNGNPEGKIFLGALGGQVVKGDRLPDGRPTRYVQGGIPIGYLDDRHIVLVAGSRGSKGRAILLPNLYFLPPTTSLLCVDPKGDHARETLRYRAEILGQRIVGLLDPFGVCGPGLEKYKVVFNVIEILMRSDRRTLVPNAKLIADALIVAGDFKDKHWDITSQHILAGLCIHVALHERYEGHRNLVTVYYLVSELSVTDPDNPNHCWLELEMLANDAASGFVRNTARAFYSRTSGEYSSVLSNLRKHVEWIGIECMAECLVGKSIDLRNFKLDSMALYASVPAMRMNDLKGWLRLLTQMTLAAHEEVPTTNRYRQTILMLDEFSILGRMSCLEVGAAQLAGLGAKILAVVQDLGQIRSKFTDSWETFIGNAGMLIFFSLADSMSLQYVSKRLGLTSCLSRSTNLPTFEQASRNAATGESWSISTQPLMTPEEICRYFARDDFLLRQLILRPGYKPAILQRIYYDRHAWLKDKIDAIT